MSTPGNRGALTRLFGSSIIDQALLSAANFAVGLMLIRYSSETQYGYYILAFNAMMLLTTLQGTFICTPLVIRLPVLETAEKQQWLGSLLRDQYRLGLIGGVLAGALTLLAWWFKLLDADTMPVLLAAIALILAALYREYFRGVLLMYRRPHGVLAADALYAAGLLGSCLLAVTQPAAASYMLLAAAFCALISGLWLRAQLRDDIDPSAAPGRLREIAHIGFWAASGGVIYWLFNQGYSFLTAATLDLTAVAALAATRLILMPINLISAGMQKQLMPLASEWMHQLGARRTLKRLLLFSLGMFAATLLYAAVAWLCKDWIFLSLMRKDFAQRDTLLLLWCVLFLIMVVREPPMLLLVMRRRFQSLSVATLGGALLALGVCYLGMLAWGPWGAIVGIICGELAYSLAIAWMIRQELRSGPDQTTTA